MERDWFYRLVMTSMFDSCFLIICMECLTPKQGLSLSYDIITKEHEGTIKADTKEGEYAGFIILLPA
jgi:hypothetical protein